MAHGLPARLGRGPWILGARGGRPPCPPLRAGPADGQHVVDGWRNQLEVKASPGSAAPWTSARATIRDASLQPCRTRLRPLPYKGIYKQIKVVYGSVLLKIAYVHVCENYSGIFPTLVFVVSFFQLVKVAVA